MALKAVVDTTHWSGHGEGGALVNIKIVGWKHDGYPYNSTDEDIARANAVAAYVTRCLAEYRGEDADGT